MIRGGDWYGGWGPPAATDAPPAWRLLTVADIGAPEGLGNWTVQAPVNAGYGFRVVKTAGTSTERLSFFEVASLGPFDAAWPFVMQTKINSQSGIGYNAEIMYGLGAWGENSTPASQIHLVGVLDTSANDGAANAKWASATIVAPTDGTSPPGWAASQAYQSGVANTTAGVGFLRPAPIGSGMDTDLTFRPLDLAAVAAGSAGVLPSNRGRTGVLTSAITQAVAARLVFVAYARNANATYDLDVALWIPNSAWPPSPLP